jgi:hypothetical protein
MDKIEEVVNQLSKKPEERTRLERENIDKFFSIKN